MTALELVGVCKRHGDHIALDDVGLFPRMTIAENIGIVPGLMCWLDPDADRR